jgi:hypothetical protein
MKRHNVVTFFELMYSKKKQSLGQSDVSSIQHYVIKLVSDLRQVRGFLSIHYVFSYNILEESVYVLLVKDEHSKKSRPRLSNLIPKILK